MPGSSRSTTSSPRWRNDPAARRLATIPGIGVMNETALVAAAIDDGRTFSRDLSAWLDLERNPKTLNRT